jgi:hydroxymethylglutaryl-CoA lyase
VTDFPRRVLIQEEGPREGFQIEPKAIPVADKVSFIEALAETGLTKIDCVSFVNPKRVPTMADAEEVAAAIDKRDGVAYTGLWLNARGLDRALQTPLDVIGAIRVTASEQFAVQPRRTPSSGRGSSAIARPACPRSGDTS